MSDKYKIAVINGPNINMLGIREPDIYGKQDYKALCQYIYQKAEELGVEVNIFQSNHEGAIIDHIQGCYGNVDGIVINPGAYTHYSYAILDALYSVHLPAVEVHISDIYSREAFRHNSVTSAACAVQISGRGFEGYIDAINCLMGLIESDVE